MDDIIEIFSEAAEPVVETLQEWGADVVEHVKEHAPLRVSGFPRWKMRQCRSIVLPLQYEIR